jgi:hypothetical protein
MPAVPGASQEVRACTLSVIDATILHPSRKIKF